MEAASAVALGLGLTLAFYLVVMSMVQGRLFDSSVKPVWHIGEAGTGLAIGVGTGAALALLVVGIISALAGHVSSDANAVIVFAQGGAVRIAALVAVSVVAAPFVEELLFRGLLAESLRGRGKSAAIWLSALAFALWHLRPNAIWYYLLVGALLGLLYWKRGLVCSMAAHATFNGLLTVIAAMSLAGPAHVVSANGVSMQVPGSWHQASASGDASLVVRNPSGAAVFVHKQAGVQGAVAADVVARMSTAADLGPDVTSKTDTAHAVVYPAGSGAQVDIVDHGHAGTAVLLTTSDAVVEIEFVDGGNAKARADFDGMLQTLSVN
jgi:membrane protease YdiL (CAAX protease family)